MYEEAEGLPAGGTAPTARLVARLRHHGVSRLLADPTTSARVASATAGAVMTLTANGFLDSHGRYLPPAHLYEPVRLRRTDGLLVLQEDAEDVQARLTEAGLAYAAEAIEGHVLLSGLSPVVPSVPCRPTVWRLTPDRAGAGDGDARDARYVIEARLERRARLLAVHLEHPDVPVRGVSVPAVSVSDDGRTWTPVTDVRRVPEWAWAGRTLLRLSGAAQDLVVPPTAAAHVRLELTLPAGSHASVTRVCARVEPSAG